MADMKCNLKRLSKTFGHHLLMFAKGCHNSKEIKLQNSLNVPQNAKLGWCAVEWHDMTGNIVIASHLTRRLGLPTRFVDAEPSVLTYAVGFCDLLGTLYALVSWVVSVKMNCHWKRYNQNAYLCMCSEWVAWHDRKWPRPIVILLSISLRESDYQLVWLMLRHQFRH